MPRPDQCPPPDGIQEFAGCPPSMIDRFFSGYEYWTKDEWAMVASIIVIIAIAIIILLDE